MPTNYQWPPQVFHLPASLILSTIHLLREYAQISDLAHFILRWSQSKKLSEMKPPLELGIPYW